MNFLTKIHKFVEKGQDKERRQLLGAVNCGEVTRNYIGEINRRLWLF